jgi:hypothetical protein
VTGSVRREERGKKGEKGGNSARFLSANEEVADDATDQSRDRLPFGPQVVRLVGRGKQAWTGPFFACG